jgi:hypothetical protein
MTLDYKITGLKEFEAAIASNPEYVIQRGKVFLTRGLAEYRKIIWRSPWRMGDSGGGAPVAAVHGGNLRDTHQQEVQDLEARIYPTADYAKYVHGIDGYPRKRNYQLRPWLTYAFEQADPAIQQHEKDLLDDLVTHLAIA